MKFFYGNIETARQFLIDHRYVRNKLSKSALNRRIHQIPMEWWENILEFIQKLKNKGTLPLEYIVDAFPVYVCRNIRIKIAGFIREKSLEDIILVSVNGFMVLRLL